MSFFLLMTEDSWPAGGDVVEGKCECKSGFTEEQPLAPGGRQHRDLWYPDRNMRLCYQPVNSNWNCGCCVSSCFHTCDSAQTCPGGHSTPTTHTGGSASRPHTQNKTGNVFLSVTHVAFQNNLRIKEEKLLRLFWKRCELEFNLIDWNVHVHFVTQ